MKGSFCWSFLRHKAFWIALLLKLLFETRGTKSLDTNSEQNHVQARDYCIGGMETFEPKCMKNQVIVMLSAVYGRMKLNRCLEDEGNILLQSANNPEFLGCSADILHILDAKCSGRNECEVRGKESDLQIIKPCWSALKNYLEAEYECVKVIEEDRACIVPVTASVQYLKSDRSSENKLSCGSRHQPWQLEAPAGQQINVSLLDFASGSRHGCSPEGYIVDAAAKRNVTVCNSSKMRMSIIYKSTSNILNIVFDTAADANTGQTKLLIGIVAVGCSDVLAPVDSWMRRMDDEAVVGCYTSRQTWRLRCVNNQWRGVIGNCTREIVGQLSSSVFDEASQDNSTNRNQVVVVACIIVLTAIICSMIICLGLVCIKRYYAIELYKLQQAPIKSMDHRFGKLNGIPGDAARDPILIQRC